MAKQAPTYQLTLAGFLLTLAGAILFSTKAVIVKLAFAHTHIDAVSLLTLRMGFSLPFYVGAVFLARSSAKRSPMSRRQWLGVIGLGLFGYYLSSLFDFLGLQYVSAGLERLILFLYPSFAVLLNALLFRQRISRVQQGALALTYIGIAIAYAGELRIDPSQSHFILGSVLVLLCAFSFSIYIVGSGRLIPEVGATRFTAYAMLAATAGIFLHFLVSRPVSALRQDPHFWWYGLALAVLATVTPTFLVSNGMKRIGSNNVAIISSIGPVSTIIQAHFILGEPIFAAQLIGTALVILGVLLIGWKSGVETK